MERPSYITSSLLFCESYLQELRITITTKQQLEVSQKNLNIKYKDYVYRKMLVQEYLKK